MIHKLNSHSALFKLFSLFLIFAFSAIHSFANQTTLTASPTEVPAGSGIGRTVLRWEIEDATDGRLYFVKDDKTLVQISQGRAGEYTEDFIFPNRTYEYRLYPADRLGVPLAAVTVVGTQKVNYLPDFPTLNQKFFKLWAIPLIVICLLLFGARFLARRHKQSKPPKILITTALILAIAGATILISRERATPFAIQPEPDAQETMDAARQMFEGKGYVTYFYDDTPQPPRYPPGFSIALLPFLSVGEFPANIAFGAKFFALFYLALAIFAAWTFGGRFAALLAALFVGVSPFAQHYAKIIMSESLTASLILLTIILLRTPSLKKVVFAGAIIGFLITVRLQLIVCLPALLLALPTMRQRLWAASASAPFLLANGIYNWKTFGSFFKSGYDYWLPNLKLFALEFGFRVYPQSDGPWIIQDWLRGWLMVWVCPCEKGGTLAALPNIVFYPLILLGVFWIFAPPFVPLYGLLTAWKSRCEPAAKFALWLSGFTLLLFTFYFYQAARFMTATSTLLLVFAAVELGKKLQRFVEPDSIADSPPLEPN